MEYHPTSPSHFNIFENYIDTQKAQGHLSEGGPLPAFLLTQKFEETPGTFDPYSYYDYSRRTLADYRPDAPLWESETPWDTGKYSKTRLNVMTRGTRSGADPANHPEAFLGFLDEDTRTPGDDHFPAWKMAQQMAARAHYLKPYEPEGATHLGEGENGDGVEPEPERYKKLNEARTRVRRNLRMFGRTIENDRPRGGREWMPLPCPGGVQSTEGGAGSGEAKPDTTMREQFRSEYRADDEKLSRQRGARRGPGEDAQLRATRVCADTAMEDVVDTDASVDPDAPQSHESTSKGADTARMMRHRGGRPDMQKLALGPDVDPRGGITGAGLQMLGRAMLAAADGARHTHGDMAADEVLGGGVTKPRSWHIDPDNQLLLLHRATSHEADRAQEILEIAEKLASRDMRGPGSLPHLAVGPTGQLGQAGRWSGGPEAAFIDDMVPSYLMVDAVMMKRACDHPRETSLIRRRMITDAHAAPAEILAAAKTANLLAHAKSASVLATRTSQDMEMGSDALQLHNLRQMSRASAPASWHRSTHDMTETQLTFEPEYAGAGINPARAAPRGTKLNAAQSPMRHAVEATRADLMASDPDHERQVRHIWAEPNRTEYDPFYGRSDYGTSSFGYDPTAYIVRDRDSGMTMHMGGPGLQRSTPLWRDSCLSGHRSEATDAFVPVGDHVRSVGGARLGETGPSRRSVLVRESMVPDRITDI